MSVKSAADSDPYFTQRQMEKMRQRNYRHSLVLSQVKQMTRNPARPAFLDRVAAKGDDGDYVAGKLSNPREAISRMVNKHLDTSA